MLIRDLHTLIHQLGAELSPYHVFFKLSDSDYTDDQLKELQRKLNELGYHSFLAVGYGDRKELVVSDKTDRWMDLTDSNQSLCYDI